MIPTHSKQSYRVILAPHLRSSSSQARYPWTHQQAQQHSPRTNPFPCPAAARQQGAGSSTTASHPSSRPHAAASWQHSMSTPIIGAGAAALGFYVWLRRWQQCGYAGVLDDLPVETHARTEQPPTSWSETLYLFKEALRYMYQETLGRWHAIDLFFGLAYLSRRAIDEYPAADIAAAGQALHDQHMQPAAAQELMHQLQEVRRYMLYCQGLKHHKPELQLKHWRITTGLEPHDVIKHSPTAGLLRPAYVIFRDTQSHTIILCVRGTHSRSDMFTSLTGTVKPHHALTPEGVALGYSHLGMLAAARWLLGQTKSCLIQALEEHPGYQLRVVGHSMGGGTAAMLTMMMREKVPQLSAATAWAIACPACMTLDLAASCAPFVTTVVHGTDIVPTFSSGAIDRLRHEVTQSSWFAEFQGDVQQRLAANFGASVRALRLGPAGEWTQRNIISTAATSLKSCYSRAPRSCYTRRSRASAMAAAACADHASPPVSPHAAAAPQHRSSWGFHLLSRHARQQQQQHADGVGSSSLQAGQQDGAFGAAADQEGAALLGGSSSQPQQPLRVLPFGWMRSMGRRGSRPGYAAAASSDGGRHSSGGAAGGVGPPNAEVALVESALQACLMAADSGQLGPGAAAAAAAGAGGGLMGQQAVPPAGAFSASSSTAAGRGAALANDFVKAASKVVLRTKRPAAPGKKDDDDTSQPPLQQSRFDQRFDASRQQHPALQPLAAAGAGNPQLPVSTGANTGSVHAPSGAPAAAAGGPTSMDGIEAAGSSGGASDPAAAASSAGKPLPTSLRSRKGWAWGGVLGAGPGDHGWVESDDSSRRSSLAGGRRVVEYLGHTVGQTGRLMVETTGHLLKSSGNVLFQACTAPMPHPAAAAAAAAAAAGLGSSGQDLSSAAAGAGYSSSGGGGGGIVVAPSSTGDMERGRDADGSFVAALAASLAAEEEEASDSDSDPDLQEGPEGDEGDSAFSLLDQPALRGNISALVAAVSSDAASAGQGLARVQQEEEQAAERLLQDLGPSISEANIQRLAVQSQQQQQQQRPPAAPAAAPGSSQQQQASSAAGRASPLPDALRRESPMPPVPGADRANTPASAEEAGGSQAAEAGGSGDGGGGSSSSRDRAAERLARRRMYPAGRVLHLMPKLACPVDSAASSEPVPLINPDAAAAADGGSRGRDAQQQEQQQRHQGAPSKLPPLTAAQGSVGLGDEYVLLEVPDAGVYGRVKLCPSMVRDHFIPSYLKALDSVLGQLQQVVAAGPGNGAAPPPHGGRQQEGQE